MQFRNFHWLSSHGICIENHMNASAYHNIWAQVMFFKFSSAIWELQKHHEWPYITKCMSDHIGTFCFLWYFQQNYKKRRRKSDCHSSMDMQLCIKWLPNCSRFLFEPQIQNCDEKTSLKLFRVLQTNTSSFKLNAQ